MRVGILGAAEARLNGAAVDLGTRKQRALLAALAMHRGRPVVADTIVDLLWGESPPTAVTATLQGYVARLRRALEPDRPPRAPSEVLVTQQSGYALLLPDDALDSARFEAVVGAAHRQLGAGVTPDLPAAEELQSWFDDLSSALSLWRGLPYTELEDAPAAQAERARLEELRAIALEDRAVAALGLGRHAMVAGELEVLTATYPLRERLWGLRALALTRSGRQADALEVLRQVRELLAEELGLEPGAELRALQTAVLRQDPTLDWTAPSSRPLGTHTRATEFAWPLVGRDDQLAALVGLLEQSQDQPVFAVVTGDPGIGKSRLCAELAAAAEAEGTTVLVGRCSQDEGAPPLYPWAKVLSELGHDLPSDPGAEGSEDSSSRFRAWEAIARTVLDAAQDRHLLVILDDLHWADTSTLRVLRLLAESADAGRLMVVSTWRHQPPPTGLLAEAAETLARRHALRLELTGLTAEEAGEIVTTVAQASPTAGEADALRLRTDGNPFFLVEYARLAREGGDLAELLAEENPPAAVQDVLTRRFAALPESTGKTLRHAAVIGRQFDVPTLAAALDTEEDDVLDDLDPALAAGLVREDGVDRLRFAHALVRDTVYAGLSRSRRGRMHARAAQVLAGTAGRESEVARHWLAAGPQNAAEAWRAGIVAAEAARRVFGHEEARRAADRSGRGHRRRCGCDPGGRVHPADRARGRPAAHQQLGRPAFDRASSACDRGTARRRGPDPQCGHAVDHQCPVASRDLRPGRQRGHLDAAHVPGPVAAGGQRGALPGDGEPGQRDLLLLDPPRTRSAVRGGRRDGATAGGARRAAVGAAGHDPGHLESRLGPASPGEDRRGGRDRPRAR